MSADFAPKKYIFVDQESGRIVAAYLHNLNGSECLSIDGIEPCPDDKVIYVKATDDPFALYQKEIGGPSWKERLWSGIHGIIRRFGPAAKLVEDALVAIKDTAKCVMEKIDEVVEVVVKAIENGAKECYVINEKPSDINSSNIDNSIKVFVDKPGQDLLSLNDPVSASEIQLDFPTIIHGVSELNGSGGGLIFEASAQAYYSSQGSAGNHTGSGFPKTAFGDKGDVAFDNEKTDIVSNYYVSAAGICFSVHHDGSLIEQPAQDVVGRIGIDYSVQSNNPHQCVPLPIGGEQAGGREFGQGPVLNKVGIAADVLDILDNKGETVSSKCGGIKNACSIETVASGNSKGEKASKSGIKLVDPDILEDAGDPLFVAKNTEGFGGAGAAMAAAGIAKDDGAAAASDFVDGLEEGRRERVGSTTNHGDNHEDESGMFKGEEDEDSVEDPSELPA